MHITTTKIKDLIILTPQVYQDSRGSFFESYNKSIFEKHISNTNFVQDNESISRKGVLRGLHFQNPPFDQAKLVRCVYGKVLDVAVDLRKNSKTYGQHEKVILSGKNNKQFYVPRGFAHGFLVLSDIAIFSYKVDNFYSKLHDSGIIWNDPFLNINWDIDKNEIIVSEKDELLESFNNFKTPFK